MKQKAAVAMKAQTLFDTAATESVAESFDAKASLKELAKLVKTYKKYRAEAKTAAQKQEEAGEAIKSVLRNLDVDELVVKDSHVIFKKIEKNNFNGKKFAADFPEIAARYTTVVVQRPLRVI